MQLDMFDKKPSLDPLDKMIADISKKFDLDSCNMYEVVKEIYERTYYKYAIKYEEERMLREKYEKTIVDKNKVIDDKDEEIKQLKQRLGDTNDL